MRPWLFIAGLDGAIAVVLAAVGAHGAVGSEQSRMVLATANRIHFLHALALLAVACLADRVRPTGATATMLTAAGSLFVGGTVLFSGTLYMQALVGIVPLPYAAPTGGMLLILGWLALAGAAIPARQQG